MNKIKGKSVENTQKRKMVFKEVTSGLYSSYKFNITPHPFKLHCK